jgi:hypothetical protein
MRKIISQIFIVLLLAISFSAQSEIDKPKLVDEFGNIPMGDLLSRLDAFSNNLFKNEKSIALIKIYDGTKARKHFIFPYTWGATMKAHLVGNRKFDAERIRVQNCDLDKDDVRVELFLVPQNYTFPKCNDDLFVPKETVLYTFHHYGNPYIVYDEVYEITGGEEATSKISNQIRIGMLNKSPESKIYIIGYLGTNLQGGGKQNSKGEWEDVEIRKLDKPSLMKKMLREVEQRLVKSSVDASRIVKVDGGYQDGTRNIEIWFIPKGGKIPKPKPDYFPGSGVILCC